MGQPTEPPNRRRRATDGLLPPVGGTEKAAPARGRRGFEPLVEPEASDETEKKDPAK